MDHHVIPVLDLNGHCFIKNNIFIPKNVINLYISYTKGRKLRNLNLDFGNSYLDL